ncbi:transmembrane protein 143 [Aplysia californica]|uniref:Transmembrane protein 143 n=1 Tax=Aplysia californica TaxID=6500 RepID=A0ABM0JK88_APLCA|nr:transmembrane protein 143 [Aplysia californica]
MAASFVRCKPGLCPQMLRLLLSQSRKTKLLPLGCQRIALSATSNSHAQLSLRLYSDAAPSSAVKATDAQVNVQPVLSDDEEDPYREHYIPVTRQSLIRHMIEERDFLTDKEKKIFPDFALALDSALVSRYNHVLQELKVLFDPINPDKDTVKTREWTRGEKLDNEFWLLQHLEDVMEKANFYELPRAKVERFLQEHEAHEGVRVSVNPNRYDVLRFWVLGHEVPEVQLSLKERLMNKLLRRSPRPAAEYYKRVVVAIRLKKDSKLILKAFKEVPTSSLEMLLPDGTIQMSTMDKGVLVTSAGIAAFGVLAKAVTVLASVHVDWMLLLTLVTGSISFRAWSLYKHRRNSYLVDVSRTLYFKNVANNRGLLSLLVDRAEDESFKEALLTYAFLLNSRPEVTRDKPTTNYLVNQLGGLTEEEIQDEVEDWIERKTGVQLSFDTGEAIRLLQDLGLLSEKNGKYHVLMLDAARRILPQNPQSVIAGRVTEADITEGYDRDEYLETEEEYKAEEEKTRKYGWF